jgi:hypothetical protein
MRSATITAAALILASTAACGEAADTTEQPSSTPTAVAMADDGVDYAAWEQELSELEQPPEDFSAYSAAFEDEVGVCAPKDLGRLVDKVYYDETFSASRISVSHVCPGSLYDFDQAFQELWSSLNEPTIEPATPTPEPEPTAEPEPHMTFTSSCEDEWPLLFQTGDSSENTMTGFRFVGEVDVYNDGNAAGEASVTFTWLYFGSGSASLTKTVSVGAGGHRNVGFVEPATVDEISNMAGHQHGDKMCKTDAIMLS